jgi:mono/diheme cytochrome c family protein
VRTPLARASAAATLAAAVLLEAHGVAAQGAETYAEVCAPCHQADGSGVPGVYPPLADRIGAFVRVPEGRAYLARAVTHGLFGAIRVDERPYHGFMPPAPQLDDVALAEVLNYVLLELSPQQLPTDFTPLTAEEVAGYREPKASPSQMLKERDALLEKLNQDAAAPVSRDARLALGPVPHVTGVAQDYARWCQGCHREDGMGARGAVPRLRSFVGHFTHLPEGREFLVRVPGVAYVPLDDARLTTLLNWMLATFSPAETAPDFTPFAVEEVADLRRRPLDEVEATRRELIGRLRSAGLVGADDGLNPIAQ